MSDQQNNNTLDHAALNWVLSKPHLITALTQMIRNLEWNNNRPSSFTESSFPGSPGISDSFRDRIEQRLSVRNKLFNRQTRRTRSSRRTIPTNEREPALSDTRNPFCSKCGQSYNLLLILEHYNSCNGGLESTDMSGSQ